MVDVTFNTGSSALVVSCQVIYGTIFNDERYNQFSNRMADGALITYDTGLNIVNGLILMKAVSIAHGELLRTWIREDAVFQLNNFSIIPGNALIDIGNGAGVTILNANFKGLTTEGVFEKHPPNIYKVNFPFTFVRS